MENRLKEVRDAKGLTQVKLAELVGCNHSTIGRIERGKRSLDDHWVARLCDALECKPNDLFVSPPETAAPPGDAVDQAYRELRDLYSDVELAQAFAALRGVKVPPSVSEPLALPPPASKDRAQTG